MDDIALDSDLTQTDRADRAREAFRVYFEAYTGSEISDLITDLLHLADIDEREGNGAEDELRAALGSYLGEVPTWPDGS